MSKKLDKEYAPISGSPEFCKAAINLALGENNTWVKDGLVSFSFHSHCICSCLHEFNGWFDSSSRTSLSKVLAVPDLWELVRPSLRSGFLGIRKFFSRPQLGEIIFHSSNMRASMWKPTAILTLKQTALTSRVRVKILSRSRRSLLSCCMRVRTIQRVLTRNLVSNSGYLRHNHREC